MLGLHLLAALICVSKKKKSLFSFPKDSRCPPISSRAANESDDDDDVDDDDDFDIFLKPYRKP